MYRRARHLRRTLGKWAGPCCLARPGNTLLGLCLLRRAALGAPPPPPPPRPPRFAKRVANDSRLPLRGDGDVLLVVFVAVFSVSTADPPTLFSPFFGFPPPFLDESPFCVSLSSAPLRCRVAAAAAGAAAAALLLLPPSPALPLPPPLAASAARTRSLATSALSLLRWRRVLTWSVFPSSALSMSSSAAPPMRSRRTGSVYCVGRSCTWGSGAVFAVVSVHA